MFRLLSFIFLCFCIVETTVAQPTVLPEDDTIFDDNIDVVAIHPVIDNANRTLSIYHEHDWVTLSYPNRLDEIYLSRSYDSPVAYPLIAQRPDNTYIFLQRLEDFRSFQVWVADLVIEQMYTIESPCHSTDINFDNPWIYVSVGVETYLCNWITGENSPPLPERLSWGATRYSRIDQPILSPERDYLILPAGSQFYSYHLETQSFASIGQVSGFHDYVYFTDWLTPTMFIVEASNMPEWSSRNQYVGDVQESSLRFAISKPRFWPTPVQEPLGFMAMNAAMRDGFTPGPCFVDFYDISTGRLGRYDTGALCDYGIPIPDGSGDQLYRAIYPSATVLRYNFFTGVRRNLYIGEVESLGAIAPDGRMGLIGLGNSGIVQTHQDPDSNFGVVVEPVEYGVMNLDTGDILGHVPVDVEWLSPNHLYNQEQLFTLTTDGITTEDLSGVVVFTRSEPPALLIETIQVLQLYDLSHDRIVRIATLPTGYNAIANELTEDVIRLTLYSTEMPTLMFDIRLPSF